jgi:oligosaccharide 4-alpha-D-glucosyltransferase
MKRLIACFFVLHISFFAFSQTEHEGEWTYQLYPQQIIKLSWTKQGMQHAEQVSDAVIAKSLSAPRKLSVLSKKTVVPKTTISFLKDQQSISVSIGNMVVHFLHGFDSGHLRGIDVLLKPKEKLFGAGERTLPMNRIGQRIPLYNNPWYGYSENADALNFSIPVLMSTEGYGLLFDNPSKGYFDIGHTRQNILEAGFESGAIDVYIIPGKNMDELLQRYALLTGRQPLPPRWALGNFVSRFGYRSQEQAEKTIAQMKADRFPVDALVIDLFWFGDSIKGTLGNLDWNKSKWPNPEKMIDALNEQNIHTILVTEPFVLRGTKNFESSQPFLATNQQGKPYELQDFYFGKGGLIDMFKPTAKDWFWQFYKKQIDKGIAGWWGDLGEPEKHPADIQHDLSSFGASRTMSANEVHGMYGHEWSKMLYEKYAANYPKQRLFFLNRAGYAGSQRYSIFPWTGDVSRSWSGLRAQLPNLQSMSLSGIPYVHSDAGGFGGGEIDGELYTRWLQFAAYTPVFRPHGTALGDLEPTVKDIPSEPCFQVEPFKSIVRTVIENRYRLMPYNYSLAFEQSLNGKPLIRPLFYYTSTDSNLFKANDQYMWGDAFLIAPVLQPNALERKLYLPKADWYRYGDVEKVAGGIWRTDDVTIDAIPVYVKAGSFVPKWEFSYAESLAAYDHTGTLRMYYYPATSKSSYTFYDDDGKDPKSVASKKYQQVLFSGNSTTNRNTITISAAQWPLGLKRKIKLLVPAMDQATALVNSKAVKLGYDTPGWIEADVDFDGKPVTIVFTGKQ